MKTRRINSHANFKGLVEAIKAFDHHEERQAGVVQCIILEGGRVITGCVTNKDPVVRLTRENVGSDEVLSEHLWGLLELGNAHQFVVQMEGMLPVLWQISD